MRLAVIGRSLIGLAPETAVHSRLSQQEIVHRAELQSGYDVGAGEQYPRSPN